MEKYGLLFESIFKRKLTDENAVGYLENLTKEHPYFSIAQFYLLQLSQKNAEGYKAQAKKTAALFNNNYWLNFQLLEAGYDNQPPASPALAEPVPEIFADKIYTEGKKEEPVIEEVWQEEPAAETSFAETLEEEKSIALVEEEKPISEPIEENKSEENIAEEEIYSTLVEDEKPSAEPVEESKPEENIVEEEIYSTLVEDEKPSAEPFEENNSTENIIEEEQHPTVVEVEKTIIEAAAENINKEETLPGNEIPVIEAKNTAESNETKPVEEEQLPVTHIAAEIPAKEEPLLFEPLHTSDYFASVGIKLSEEEKTSDKLGKQLKSFTDWLKTMKKVHTAQLAQTTTTAEVETAGAESSIQKLAEKSNQENDVITEAMADVLLQQGRQDKAIEILEKLSLLNPPKNAYFASKINQIKEK